jgi:hypothetical protein
MMEPTPESLEGSGRYRRERAGAASNPRLAAEDTRRSSDSSNYRGPDNDGGL